LVLSALCALAAARPNASARAADARQAAIDVLVQDVCVDDHDHVMPDVTPLDDGGRCTRTRDLRVGEALPYHKDDWANDAGRATRPQGLQRSDSFPVRARGELLIVDTFQFGAGPSFDRFSPGDGGQIIRVSRDAASVILTQDSKGLKYFFGSRCTVPPQPEALDGSWILFELPAMSERVSALTAHLQQTLDPARCPKHLASAYTEFYRADVRYRADEAHHLTRPLYSIVTDHFSNTSVSGSGSMERMYFTKALGLTRWERWQNLDMAQDDGKGDYQRRAARLRASGRCDIRRPAPGRPGSWVLVDCREWTNLIGSGRDAGARPPPAFWIRQLEDNPATDRFFGEP
jgi:hypothetical protein